METNNNVWGKVETKKKKKKIITSSINISRTSSLSALLVNDWRRCFNELMINLRLKFSLCNSSIRYDTKKRWWGGGEKKKDQSSFLPCRLAREQVLIFILRECFIVFLFSAGQFTFAIKPGDCIKATTSKKHIQTKKKKVNSAFDLAIDPTQRHPQANKNQI